MIYTKVFLLIMKELDLLTDLLDSKIMLLMELGSAHGAAAGCLRCGLILRVCY